MVVLKQFKDWVYDKINDKVIFNYEEIGVEVAPNLCDECGKDFPIEELIIICEDNNDESIQGSMIICPKCYSKRCDT